ncbi:Fc.00g070050.m01.CDS01 [Cosmosporella sp. VM-42]
MSQQMPMAAPAAPGYPSSMPTMHAYQHQLPPPPPPPHPQQHPPQHQHQHQHQPQHPHQHQQHQHQPPPPPPPPPPHHLQHHPLHQPQHQAQHQLPHQHQHQHQQSRPDEAPPPPAAPPSSERRTQPQPQQVLAPASNVEEATSRRYSLDVVQQPRRARMCGFGDKDRRPITPPPCVRLIITDLNTGKEVDVNDIDHSMFVLNVDLWSEDGSREVNLVRSSTGTPSISSTTPYSYSTLNGSDSNSTYPQQVLASSRDHSYGQSPAMGYVQDYPVQQGYGQVPTSNYPPNGSYGPPQQYFPQHGGYRDAGVPGLPSQGNMAAPFRNGSQPGYGQDQNQLARMVLGGGQPQGMFTRNLIGSLAASAFRLSDTHDHMGIWFVLQDLSVRTEGPFRLRFSFVNVGPVGGSNRDGNGAKVNTGRAPILASCFSEVFNVYSAKKFPGVCESTSLSKTFATQGIKIPIRKDSNVKGGDGGEDDYD